MTKSQCGLLSIEHHIINKSIIFLVDHLRTVYKNLSVLNV